MKIKIYSVCIVVAIFMGHFASMAQVIYPEDHTREYYDLLTFHNPEMPHPITIQPSIISQYGIDTALQWNLWDGYYAIPERINSKKNFKLVNPIMNYSANTETPRGYNDGAIWSGKGSNIALSGGFIGNVGILHFAFIPIYSIAQNKEIEIPENVSGYPKSQYSYPFSGKIDWVQQYGVGSYSQFNLGQSEIRLVYKKVTLGVSTENFKWGPSIWNPILMSNNAAGFPHLDFGTAAPIETKVGKFEAKWYWGAASESSYFDDKPENDRSYITGFSIGFEPSLIPGLSMGLNRIMYTRWADEDLSKKDFFAAFLKNKSKGNLKNDEYDQMASVTMKYRFPSVGFEAYVEYARNDFPGTFGDLVEQPDRTRAVVLGAMKIFKLKDERILKLAYEYTSLSLNQTQLIPQNGKPPYYVHNVVERGYTHQGQIIGAGIGPGSNGSLLKVDIFNPKGKIGFLFSRIRFNDDYFLSTDLTEAFPTDYEASLGLNYVRYFDNFSIQPELMWNYRKNWYYQDEITLVSWHLGLQVQYRIR